MKKELNKIFYTSLLTSIIFVIIGVLLLLFPGATIKSISYILGLIIALAGVMGFVKFFIYSGTSKYDRYGLAYGIVFLVVACFFFFKTEDIAEIMPFAVGIYIIIKSALKMEYTLKLKQDDNDNWKVTLVMSIISIIFGLVLIFNPFKSILLFTQVIGFIIIFYSILDIVDSYVIKCNLKELKEKILDIPVQEVKEEVVTDNIVSDEALKKTNLKKSTTTKTKKNTSSKTKTTSNKNSKTKKDIDTTNE